MLRVRITVVEFDDIGIISDYIILDSSKEYYGAEIAPKTWYTIISIENDGVPMKLKMGLTIKQRIKILLAMLLKKAIAILTSL